MNRKTLIPTILLIAFAYTLSFGQTTEEIVATLDIDTLMENGPKDNRINIAFANITNPQGTNTYANKTDLNGDIADLIALMDINHQDHKSGFSHYRDFFNIYSVWFPDPIVFETVPSFYETTKNVRDAIFLPWEDDRHGWITMMYTLEGGGGGGAGLDRDARTGFVQLYGLDIHTVFHEFNHTMAGVHDEYLASGAWSNFIPIEGANVTGAKHRDDIPWRKWIEPDLPIPTPYEAAYTNNVGLFHGNISGYFDSFRPTARSCYMGAGGFGEGYGQDLCSPCLQKFISMLYQYVNVIESPLPASDNLTVNGNESITFSADILKPEPNTQKYKWYVNDVLYQEDVESIEVNFDACDSYTVKLVVTDETEFVRYDEKFDDVYPKIEQSHVWNINQESVNTYDLSVATTTTDADCTGQANGSITIDPSGGSAPYEIYLDGVEQTSSIEGLAPGSYNLVVSDSKGCSVSEQVEIDQSTVFSYEICSNKFGGLWDLSIWSPMEGDETVVDASKLDFLWSTGSTLPSIQVSSGTYSVEIISPNGCTVSRQVSIEDNTSPIDVIPHAQHVSGDENGSILLDIAGIKPYEILWYTDGFLDQTSPEADQVISSGHVNQHQPVDAFDNSSEHTNFWADGFSGSNYIGFDFGKATKIEAYSIASNNDTKGRDAKSWILQGSADGSSWTDIVTANNVEFTERLQRKEYKLDQPATYRYFRLYITENWGDGWLAIREIEFGTFEKYELEQFRDFTEIDELTPTTYQFRVRDGSHQCVEGEIEIQELTVSMQSIDIVQDGHYSVKAADDDPDITYYWAANSDMSDLQEVGTSFQPNSPGQYFVKAYNKASSTFVSDAHGFAITMPGSPQVLESNGTLEIVDPKDGHEYIWYDLSKGGTMLHNGTSYTPAQDGYYYVSARETLDPVTPIDPGSLPGIQLWMDASDLDADGVADSDIENSAAHEWFFREGGRWQEHNFFIYRNNYQNGLGIADLSLVWFQRLDGGANQLRTIILVYEENNLSPAESAPLWGLNNYIPRHTDASQLLSNNTPATTLDGRVYLNGELIDPLSTPNPMSFIALSTVFTETITREVNSTMMQWDGKIAELLIWNVELSHEEVIGVNEYLRKKWLSTAHLESARTEVSWGGNPAKDDDQDGYDENSDCDDSNPDVHPGATEICDGIDNDCDGEIDEGFVTTYYADLDQDGFGDAAVSISACQASEYYVLDNTDCDDNNASVNSNQSEIPYNGIDDDCNASTLDDDLDQDGFVSADDCDDTNASINPDQDEIPYNGIDDDCDASTLDDDLDQDGFNLADDCDDTNANINPDATEIFGNDVDEDCDGISLVLDIDMQSVQINFYPNPATDRLIINSDKPIHYQIVNMSGMQVKKGTWNGTPINISSLIKGVYVMVIEGKSETLVIQ